MCSQRVGVHRISSAKVNAEGWGNWALLHLLPDATKSEKAGHCKIILTREVMCFSGSFSGSLQLKCYLCNLGPPWGTATLNQCKIQQSYHRALVEVQSHARPVDILSCLHARLCLQAASWSGGSTVLTPHEVVTWSKF